jgi:hypothetical protein
MGRLLVQPGREGVYPFTRLACKYPRHDWRDEWNRRNQQQQ